ncbi:hypothetical protein U9M48_003892, partial [Paspalum notatum var. saurae]
MARIENPTLNSHITMDIKLALACRHLKPSTKEKCWTSLVWSGVGEYTLVGLDLINEAEEKVLERREKLMEAQSKQKSYAENSRRGLSFKVEDFMYLKLPESMSDIHDVLHVSQFKKCLKYKEVLVKILDIVTRETRNSTVWICRVLWSHHGEEEATWETEDALRKEQPHLFQTQPNLKDEIPSKWG